MECTFIICFSYVNLALIRHKGFIIYYLSDHNTFFQGLKVLIRLCFGFIHFHIQIVELVETPLIFSFSLFSCSLSFCLTLLHRCCVALTSSSSSLCYCCYSSSSPILKCQRPRAEHLMKSQQVSGRRPPQDEKSTHPRSSTAWELIPSSE